MSAVPSEGSREESFLASLVSAGPGHSLVYREITPISVSIFTLPSFFCVSMSSLLIRTPVIGFRAHPKSRKISSGDP